MAYSFFDFWVSSLFGSEGIALMGTAGILFFIGIMGRMSYLLLGSLMMFYFVTFGSNFYGPIVYLPSLIISMLYFFNSLYRFLQRD